MARILTTLLLSTASFLACEGFDIEKLINETMKLPTSRRLPLKKAMAAPAAAGIGEGVTAVEYDEKLNLKLRKLALETYQSVGAWTRSTSAGYNIPMCTRNPFLCEEAYSLFMEKAKEVYEPFEVDEKTNNRGLFAAVSNQFDQHIAMHDHKRSCEISGLVYVSIPDNESGISFLVNNGTRYIDVTQGLLYFWPGDMVHAPGATKGLPYRISINMEFKTKGGVVPRIKKKYRGTQKKKDGKSVEQVPYAELMRPAMGVPPPSKSQEILGIANQANAALKIYDSCEKNAKLVTELPPGHFNSLGQVGEKSWGVRIGDAFAACIGKEVRGRLFCSLAGMSVVCNPEERSKDEL